MASSPKGKEVLPKTEGGALAQILAGSIQFPSDFDGLVDFKGWAESLVNKVDYKEPNPDYLSSVLLMQTLTKATADDIMSQDAMDGLQKVVPNVPGASTGPIDIYGLYPTSSDLSDGMKTYIIIQARDLDSGREWRTTTGSGQVQAQCLTLIAVGMWPIRCQIKRLERKDRGGRHLFWVAPSDEGH